MSEQMWVLKITATGEVRDADGTLLNSGPVEATKIVTAEEAAAIMSTGETSWQEG